MEARDRFVRERALQRRLEVWAHGQSWRRGESAAWPPIALGAVASPGGTGGRPTHASVPHGPRPPRTGRTGASARTRRPRAPPPALTAAPRQASPTQRCGEPRPPLPVTASPTRRKARTGVRRWPTGSPTLRACGPGKSGGAAAPSQIPAAATQRAPASQRYIDTPVQQGGCGQRWVRQGGGRTPARRNPTSLVGCLPSCNTGEPSDTHGSSTCSVGSCSTVIISCKRPRVEIATPNVSASTTHSACGNHAHLPRPASSDG